MSTNNYPTPDETFLAQLGNVPEFRPHQHEVQFYTRDTFLLEELSRFVGTALGAGDAAVVVATEPHRQALLQRLGERGLDVMLAVHQGRYVSLDAGEVLSQITVDAMPDSGRFIEIVGGMLERAHMAAGRRAPVSVFGEMVAILWAREQGEAAIELEQLWNELARTYSFWLRCAYPISGFDRLEHEETLLRICEAHSQVIPAEGYSALQTDDQRRRKVTILQQKAQALEAAVAERREIEKSLHRRENELADLLENAVEGVQQVDADQKIRWANRSLLSMLGYAPEEYVGHRLPEFHADRTRFNDFWQRLMRRENIYDFTAEMRCKDGTTKLVVINSNGLWENGRLVHTRCFIRDVTENTRMEAVLRRSEKLAATGRLAASIAHEINNPLESLTNLLYLLQTHGPLPERAREYATLADRELKRVAHITRQMLSFYRESARPTRFNLAEVLDSVVELHAPKLRSLEISVEKQYATEGEMDGFPSEIRQLFVNLLGNAIEASPRRGAIRLRIAATQEPNHFRRRGVRVTIADDGSGIAPENRKKIFDPFFTTKGEAGTGLGLWVSRGIVQKHDGTIHFRSRVGEGRSGTVFCVFLPAAAAQPGRTAQGEEPKAA